MYIYLNFSCVRLLFTQSLPLAHIITTQILMQDCQQQGPNVIELQIGHCYKAVFDLAPEQHLFQYIVSKICVDFLPCF